MSIEITEDMVKKAAQSANLQQRNTMVLADFVKYCRDNPELRFWQALRNWSGFIFIYGSNMPEYNIEFDPTLGKDGHLPFIKDTFYLEGKNK